MLKDRILHYIFDRYMSWRLSSFLHPKYPILLDYPVSSQPRYGYGKPPHRELHELIERNRDRYTALLRSFLQYGIQLSAISDDPDIANETGAPTWCNPYFMGLDAVALYSFLSLRSPSIFLEIGSGNSTKFARQAITDHDLNTKIISCDPYPRADIDALCDQVVRNRVEDIDLTLFDQLKSGDILFIDNSHTVFMNSDAAVVFLDILPRLKPGVVVHIHDVFLPLDYPPQWVNRHYAEQYLLAAWLLAEGSKFIFYCRMFLSVRTLTLGRQSSHSGTCPDCKRLMHMR